MDTLPQDVIKEIEKRGAVQKPAWHFTLARTLSWLLAILSVVIGGIAFSIAFFVFFDNDGTSLAALEQSSIYDVAQGIPFVWLFVLGLFVACARFSFRRTRAGYRYATAAVVGIAVAASVLLGLALDTADFGRSAHLFLLRHTSFYDALIHSRDDETD